MPLRHKRPSAEYMRELRAVARAAASLREQLPTINLLPDGFPLDQVGGFCDSLVRLPNGTAEGSIAPLRAADSELNRIRQRFIPAYSEEDDDDEPLVARDGNLDLRLVSLMAAVRSAIERYKVEAGEELDTDVTPDLPFNLDAEQPIEEAVAALDVAGMDIAHAEGLFEAAADDVKLKLETEQRLVSDSGTQVASAKAALSTESPRSTVLEWLGDGLSQSATELERHLEPYREKAIAIGKEVGGGIGEIIEAWLPLAATLRIATTTTRKVVAILKSGEPGENQGIVGPPSDDFDYVEVYNALLSGEKIPDLWTTFVFELDFLFRQPHHLDDEQLAQIEGSGDQFGNLSLLTSCRNLVKLDLRGTQIADVSPLAALTALQSLNLRGTQIADVSPLAALTALQSLNLMDTQIADVSPLASLIALQTLDLTGTQVVDVSPLAALTALQSLDLWGTQVADVSPLAALTALQSLDLWGTQVADVSPLAALAALQSLNLMDTQIADVSPLASLIALQTLDLMGTQVADVSPLASLTALQTLDLTGTQVVDVSPLASLTALQTLDLTGTQVVDVSPLAALTALQSLNLMGTQVADVSPLASLTALQTLDLTGTQVVDVSMLSHISGLKILGDADNWVTTG